MKHSPAQQHFVFLTLPGYSFVALSSAVEVLQTANAVHGRAAYAWTTASMDGQPARASNGLCIHPTVDIHTLERADIVFVCGGTHIQEAANAEVTSLLRRLALRHRAMGGLCTGAFALAKAGLLNQYKAAIHWENKYAAQELFAHVLFTDKLFAVDRDRYTCAGGTASLHLMLRLVKDHLGAALAVTVSEHLSVDRIRDEQERQYAPMQTRVGHFQAHLIEIAELMEANIEEPLSLNDIAGLVGISRRQLERLFKRYVGEIPTRYYSGLRLRHARDLVLQTTMGMGEIAVACGFSNGAYFSRCYRDAFGLTPSAERSRHATPGNSEGALPVKEPSHHRSTPMLPDMAHIHHLSHNLQLNAFTPLYATGQYAAQ